MAELPRVNDRRGPASELGLDARFVLRRGDFSLDVALTCPPGVTCVMGPSGSGKSTILAVVAGLTPPDSGTVRLGDEVWVDRGKDITVPVHHRRLAFVFQGLALFPHMTALRNVTYGMAEAPDRHERAHKLLERVGVAHLAHRRPRTFSGGEAQRVALARALARSPKLVLLDEPYSALDHKLRAQLIELERALAGELGVPIVHVTHSVSEARQLADQVIRMERGRIVATGKPADVLADVTD
jgi:molybdate transport system ATP-binding protein